MAAMKKALHLSSFFWVVFLSFPWAWLAAEDHFLIRSWQSEDGLPSNNIRSLAQSLDGYLWIATAEGVVEFDGVRFSSVAWEQTARLGGTQPPRAVFALENGQVWIATLRGELWKWSGGQMLKVWEEEEAVQESRRVKRMISEGADEVWIECADGVYCASGDGEPVRVSAYPDRLKREGSVPGVMMETGETLEMTDRQGNRWRRTEASGLAVAISGEVERVLRAFSEGVVVSALLEDCEGNVWVATNGSGLFQIRTRRVQVIDTADGITDRKVRALLEDRRGGLWAANRSGGIDLIQAGGVESFALGEPTKSKPVSCLCEDGDGVLWVGTEGGAVYRRSSSGFETMTGDKPWMRKLGAMIADRDGNLWLGGADGLAVWEKGTVRHLGPGQGIPEQQITALALDADGVLYVGTVQGAVLRQSSGHFEQIVQTAGAAVSALLLESGGTVWVTTLGEGLYLYLHGRQIRIAAKEALPDERLTCVLDDGAGFMWLGSLAGIFRVAKADLLEIAAGRRAHAEWIHLDRADGMTSRECTGAFQPAGWRGRDGTLWFPTVHGIATIRPPQFTLNREPPKVRIEKVTANGQVGSLSEARLQTGPGRSRLEFHFTAPSFAAAEKVRFRTRLEGLQSDWQDVGSQRSVFYESVPPGDYVFQVLAANNDRVWSERAATFAVQVRPHFYETVWFQTLAVLGVVGVAFGVGGMIARARARMKLLRLEAQTGLLMERERIAQDLHDDLGASLTEISLLAGLAVESASTAKIPVIAGKAQQLVSTLDEIVWAVNPRHDTLASFAEYVSASAAEMIEVSGLALRLERSTELPEVPLDSVQRHALFLAVREALNNAVKHSGASEVRLSIDFTANRLVIMIMDDGQGFSATTSHHSEGLRNMQNRLAGIGGTCQIESGTGGTMVKFTLRVDEM
ncbi:MAG: hypothetical protein IPK32_06225 [Verrucomicrobiaceae bacterium]|nr:hypothetical protein [Verrucomicrobiaceae bacterium]